MFENHINAGNRRVKVEDFDKLKAQKDEIVLRQMADTCRLDWLEKQDGCGLISDDAGRWAMNKCGYQNYLNPDKTISYAKSSVWVGAHEWKPSIRAAIDYAMREGK